MDYDHRGAGRWVTGKHQGVWKSELTNEVLLMPANKELASSFDQRLFASRTDLPCSLPQYIAIIRTLVV
jgi:hypothetical protein